MSPGIQSPNQMELLAKHDPARPVFVEGPFPLWLRRKCVHYYILRADPTPHHEEVTFGAGTVTPASLLEPFHSC